MPSVAVIPSATPSPSPSPSPSPTPVYEDLSGIPTTPELAHRYPTAQGRSRALSGRRRALRDRRVTVAQPPASRFSVSASLRRFSSRVFMIEPATFIPSTVGPGIASRCGRPRRRVSSRASVRAAIRAAIVAS